MVDWSLAIVSFQFVYYPIVVTTYGFSIYKYCTGWSKTDPMREDINDIETWGFSMGIE